MINIYSPGNTVYTNNGNATLVPVSCILSLTINGTWKIEMEHPYDPEGRWNLIVQDAVLAIERGGVELDYVKQLYRIYNVERGLKSIKCEAYPIALDAFNEVIIDDVKANNISGATLASRLSALPALDDLGYAVLSDITATGTARFKDTNLIAVINGEDVSFVNNWGGEVKYDNKYICVNQRVDSNLTPIILRAGRDITDANYTVDSTNVVTRIYPLSNAGYRLNLNEDYQIDTHPYVDSPLIGNYPIVHAEFVQTPYMLVTQDEDNEDQEAYDHTDQIYEDVKQTVSTFTHDWYDSLEANIGIKTNNEYLQYILNLSEEVEGVSGIWETIFKRYARVLHNSSFKEVIKQAIREGCQWIDELPTPEYILVDVEVSGVTKTIYCDPSDETKRATTDWVNLEGKWMYFDSNGYYDSTKDDASTWGWWQGSGNNYKYYGNKTSGNYMKSQWQEIDGTWYWFGSGGKGRKNKALRTLYTERLITVADNYAELAREHEEDCYQRLYGNMTAFAYDLFSKGVDKPRVTIDVSAIDISNVSEYRNARNIVLGDNVTIITDAFTSNERVVEVEYDCITKQNNKIVLGFPSENLNFIINRNLDTGLVAGEGVTIEGKVINCIGGGGGGSGGLKYWTETPNAIYQEMETGAEGGWSAPKQYLRTAEIKWTAGRPFGSTPIHLETRPNPRRPDTLAAWWKKDGYWMMLFMSDEEQNVNVYDSATSEEYAGKYYGNLYGIDWYVKEVYAFQTDYPAEFIDEGNIFFIEDDPEYMANWRGHPYEYLAQLVFKTTYVRAGMGFDDYSYLFWGGTGKYDPGQIPYYVTQDGLIHTDEDVEIGEVSVAGSLTYLNEYKQDVLTAGDGISIDDETDEISVNPFTGATSEADGSKGGVPQPLIADRNSFLQGNGTWGDPTPPDMTGATSQDNGVHGLVPAPLSTDRNKYLKGDGTWAEVQGGGGAGAEEMTKAQYDALTTEQKNDGTIRFIYDYP